MADGEYHHVEILAVKKNFTLKVDGGLARSIINEGKNEYLGCYVDQILREGKRKIQQQERGFERLQSSWLLLWHAYLNLIDQLPNL